jgi:hypothetical protein
MNIQHTVSRFLSQGKDLYRRLRSSKGGTLSDVDLMSLREQLHILDTEAGHLQDLKQFRSTGRYQLRLQRQKATSRQAA